MATSSDKHARQKENRSRVDAARAEMDAQARRKRLFGIGGVVVVLIAVIVAIVALTSGSDDEKVAAKSPAGNESTVPEPSDSVPDTAKAITLPAPPEGETLTTPTECPPVDGSATRVQKFAGPPPDCLTPGASYTATFDTTEGSFTATLAGDVAPKAVNNFVVLSRYRYYDGVPFHRIISGFVIQAGDGDGEPWGNNDLGYSFEDELPKDSSAYTDYSLAMANSGPDTNGSQFFVVLPGGGSKLQPSYTMFGQVTEGQDVVDAIGALNDGGETPTKVILINNIKINETPAP
ncbi:MAG TPA: peptidylprolyl isomerase [Microthrixaceae bacterium]|nr:peptidylprolyl isomerase [Microthrixaceae bacterium]